MTNWTELKVVKTNLCHHQIILDFIWDEGNEGKHTPQCFFFFKLNLDNVYFQQTGADKWKTQTLMLMMFFLWVFTYLLLKPYVYRWPTTARPQPDHSLLKYDSSEWKAENALNLESCLLPNIQCTYLPWAVTVQAPHWIDGTLHVSLPCLLTCFLNSLTITVKIKNKKIKQNVCGGTEITNNLTKGPENKGLPYLSVPHLCLMIHLWLHELCYTTVFHTVLLK